MGLFDRFHRKPQGSWMAVRTAAVAEKFPTLLDPDTVGSSRAELQRCSACGGLTEDVVITTGGPLGDPELWRRHPVALDACRCKECGQVSYPIALEPAEIKALLDAGAAAAQSGNLNGNYESAYIGRPTPTRRRLSHDHRVQRYRSESFHRIS